MQLAIIHLDFPHGIRLTEFQRSDKESLIEHLSDKDIYDRTSRIPYPYTAADAEHWLAIVAQTTAQSGQLHWAIRDESEKLLGAIGLELAGACASHRAEIGYWLAKPNWNRGIATAAVRALCRHAFEQMELSKITAYVFAFNDASARVLEKCGFVQEGYQPKHYLKDGRFIDSKLYGLAR